MSICQPQAKNTPIKKRCIQTTKSIVLTTIRRFLLARSRQMSINSVSMFLFFFILFSSVSYYAVLRFVRWLCGLVSRQHKNTHGKWHCGTVWSEKRTCYKCAYRINVDHLIKSHQTTCEAWQFSVIFSPVTTSHIDAIIIDHDKIYICTTF